MKDQNAVQSSENHPSAASSSDKGPSEPTMGTMKPPKSIVVVHSNGVFTLNVRWCKCNVPTHKQLLRAHLYPASTMNPSTAFTEDVLDHFYMDALECKTSAWNFYSKLRRFTDNVFPDKVPVSANDIRQNHVDSPRHFRIVTELYSESLDNGEI